VRLVEPAGAVVVDIGCGGGTYTRAWSELGAARVVGLVFERALIHHVADLGPVVAELRQRLREGPVVERDRWTVRTGVRPPG
jgi:hypothetical protein